MLQFPSIDLTDVGTIATGMLGILGAVWALKKALGFLNPDFTKEELEDLEKGSGDPTDWGIYTSNAGSSYSADMKAEIGWKNRGYGEDDEQRGDGEGI